MDNVGMSTQGFILKISCPDRPGIVHAVSQFLFNQTANILDSAQFSDTFTSRFFMRVHFAKTSQELNLQNLQELFKGIGDSFQMDWELFDAASKPKVLIMVSKLGHCLNDLLFRTHSGYLPIEIAGIVSNHQDFQNLAAGYKIPFHFMPLSSANDERKNEQEEQLQKLQTLIEQTQSKIELTKNELATVYQYIDELPKASQLNQHLLGHYPFDKVSQIRSNQYIADNNRNVKASEAPNVAKGIKGESLEFKSDFDRFSRLP